MNTPVFTWPHKNENGAVIGEIRRFRDPENGGKSDIPFYVCNGKGFEPGTTDEMKETGNPLFGLDSFKDKNRAIFVVEGQKSQSALASLGFQCVSSILGAGQAGKSNWGPIVEASEVILMPDNDDAGEAYIRDIIDELNAHPKHPRIKILRLPGLPGKGDVCDWLKSQPELSEWDELKSLMGHKHAETVRERLSTVIKENLDTVPESWLSKNEVQEVNDWPNPESLHLPLQPVETLAPEMIPEPFRPWCVDVAHRMQTPIDFMAVTSICIAGAIIGSGCGIKPKRKDDWLSIPNLWGGLVARPSMLKTPSIEEGVKPLKALEARAKEDFDERMKQHQIDLMEFQAKKDSLKSDLKKAASGKGSKSMDEIKDALLEMEEPEEPSMVRYLSNDGTIEKLSELLNENPRGLILLRDELIGALTSWEKPGRESDRAFFLEAWNGTGSHVTDRIGRGTVFTENLTLAVFGGIQPSKLIAYLCQAADELGNDGLIQRFQLLVYPDEVKGWKLIDQSPDHQARLRTYKIIERLANMNFQEFGAVQGDWEKFPYLRFSGDAQSVFNEWLTDLELNKLRGDDHPLIQEHLGKYRSLMPSLALIFHLIDIADGGSGTSISVGAAEKAAAWCEYLETHARRIYGLVIGASQKSAVILAGKVEEGKLKDGFSLRDVYRIGWHQLSEKEMALEACMELIEAGWLREQVDHPPRGGKPKILYRINPLIKRKVEVPHE